MQSYLAEEVFSVRQSRLVLVNLWFGHGTRGAASSSTGQGRELTGGALGASTFNPITTAAREHDHWEGLWTVQDFFQQFLHAAIKHTQFKGLLIQVITECVLQCYKLQTLT